MSMKIVEVVNTPEGQVVHLPPEFRFHTASISIRRDGQAIVLEPVEPTTWPEGFFEKIRIDDATFKRPDHGEMPPAPKFD